VKGWRGREIVISSVVKLEDRKRIGKGIKKSELEDHKSTHKSY